jgi:hypothetical protein
MKVWGWSSVATSFVRHVADFHHSICRATGPGILLQNQMRQFLSDQERERQRDALCRKKFQQQR